MRAIAYMCAKGTQFNLHYNTFLMHSDTWCEIACDECRNGQDVLVENRCDEHMVWQCNKNVEMYNPGEYIMGDINTLGWDIMWGFAHERKLTSFYKEMKNVKGTKKDFEDWKTIQNKKENTMQFNHFVARNPHGGLFRAQWLRQMRIQKVKDK